MKLFEDDSTVIGASVPPEIPIKTTGLFPKWRPSIANVGLFVLRPLATAFVTVSCCCCPELLFCDSALSEQKRVRQTKSTNVIHEVFLSMGPPWPISSGRNIPNPTLF
jgi:hypothetical protein